MCDINGATTTVHLALDMSTVMVEYFAHTVLNQVGECASHFTPEDIARAAEAALQQRFGDWAEDTDAFLFRFVGSEGFLRKLGV